MDSIDNVPDNLLSPSSTTFRVGHDPDILSRFPILIVLLLFILTHVWSELDVVDLLMVVQVSGGHRQVQVHIPLALFANFGKKGSVGLKGVESSDSFVIGT